jgi:hypothetical protein
MEQPNVAETERLQQLYSRRVVASGGGDGPHATPEAILAVVQREGSEEERLATLEHVMACAACHRDYEWLSAVDQAGAEAEGAPATRAARPWWRGAPLALAASIAVAVGAAVVLSNALRPGPERERGVGGDIALVTPGATAAAGGPLTFTWRPVAGVSRYVLEVQRANGSIAFADTTADTSATLADPSRLTPDSAYRWWVREATEGTEPRSSAFRDLRLTSR